LVWVKQVAEFKIPLKVQLDLTYRCNLKCIHCCFYRLGNNKEELSTLEVKNIIFQLSKLGTIIITLSGGEIFLRKDALELFEFISNLGMKIKIYSNLTLCSEKTLKMLNGFSIYQVETSVYGSRSFSHDRITQVKGSFAKTIRGIKALKNNGIKVLMKCAFIEETIKEYEKIIELAKRMGIELTFGDFVINEKAFNEKNAFNSLRFHRVNLQNLEKLYSHPYILKQLNIEDLKQRNFILEKDNLEKPICEAGHYKLHIRPNGDIFPCGLWLIKLGNVREIPIDLIWNNSDILERIRQLKLKDFKDCLTCDSIQYCDLCPAITYDLDHNRCRKNFQYCKKAKLLHKLCNRY